MSMKMSARKRALAAAAAVGMAVVMSAGAAGAGEITGTGQETGARVHSRSLCAFSGLEDNDFESPVVPGVVQNWGHTKSAFGLTGGANSVQTPFGEEGCNAHLYPRR
jgi:hypothetical protein